MNDRKTALLVACEACLARGWRVVPIAPRSKAPRLHGWVKLRMDIDDLDAALCHADNLGVLLGEPSGWLVDIDLDCPEAVALAEDHLPPTGMVTGRGASPRSHRWYIAPGARSRRFNRPGSPRESMMEIRSTGGQTLIGPSIHPSGDVYDALAGEPAEVDAEELTRCIESMARVVARVRRRAAA